MSAVLSYPTQSLCSPGLPCSACDDNARVRQRLVALGYEIEDMGATYGPVYRGQFRWLLLGLDITVPDPMIAFQDHEPSYDEADAWNSALRHAQETSRWSN
jgi:hypothetical protein